MIKQLVRAVFGTQYDREMKKIRPLVEAIKQEEARLAGLSNEAIQGQTALFRARLAERLGPAQAELEEVRQAKHQCEDPHERDRLETRFHELEANYKKALAGELDALLPEAYATVREAARRLAGTTVMVTGRELRWDMVHYDVQLIGGIVLHQGKIAEMATGEGKTLVATLPLYLNALAGRGAHLVTVNNYLARRDSQWMGHLYTWLGLTVAVLDDTTALISLGGSDRSGHTARLARPNVRVEPYVDQRRALRDATLFITHHGLNSTHEAVLQRVPMLSYPFFGDQPAMATRCQELGLALPLAAAPRAAITIDTVIAAMACAVDERARFAARLDEARDWELATIRARPAVIARILELMDR